MPEPNEDLTRARNRIKSPNGTGGRLTRKELAELVNTWVAKRDPRAVPIDHKYIGKLEQGVIRWPRDVFRREALRTILRVAEDTDLGFYPPAQSRTVEAVDRQQFLRHAVGVATGATLGQSTAAGPDLPTPSTPIVGELVQSLAHTPVPRRIGADDVERIRMQATVFSNMDAAYGSLLIREAVNAQMTYAIALLDAHCEPDIKSRMLSAVGYLAHTFAFSAFDRYDHDYARELFGFACGYAEQAGDWHLRAKVLSSMARQAIWCGDLESGLTFAELGLVRADRLTATERAMLHTARARALAKLRRAQDAAAAVGAADEEFSKARPHNDPPWMAYYDAAQHAGDTGHALYDTAVLGGLFVGEARHRLAQAAVAHDEGHARSRAISQTKLASLTMATGDPVEAAAIGHQAVIWSGTVRSQRAADDLRELRRLALPYARKEPVRELQSQICTVVPI
ncbi:hypothetical protein JOF53_006506 [Crossiella equi]|uniref:XRE family transcriptional regulator n=1 Tax=Crossiella equi TaxID=130796 RepID=A0ABS5AM42_9PSEU|nr:hypothetical protein [Crossiella equi]MBP2477634.1 hypothetical protein [Crossiella equi]